MTAYLLKSPGLFSVFWLTSIMLWFGWCSIVLWFQNLPIPSSTIWGLFWTNQLQLMSPPASCSIVFFVFVFVFVFFFSFRARSKYLYLFGFFHFHSVVRWNGKVHYSAGSLSLSICLSVSLSLCWLSLGSLAKVTGSISISKSRTSLCVSFSRTDSSLCLH